MDRMLSIPRAALLAILLASGLFAQDVRPLTILHTNDTHAALLPDSARQGGLAHLATAIRRERAASDACLVLDAGDIVQGSPVSSIFHGTPIYEIMSLVGPDVSTLGNHEFDYGWEMIHEYIATARFPIVSCNVIGPTGGLLVDRPYVILDARGIRVAVIGALSQSLGALASQERLGPCRALPVEPALRRFSQEVRDRSDLVVALIHVTPDEEDRLLESVPEIPVFVSGHHHGGLEAMKVRDGRVLVRLKHMGRELGRLDLRLDTARKSVVSSTWKRIAIDAATIPAAEDVAKAIAGWEAKVAAVVDVPIGESRREFSRPELKPIIEQAIADEMKADFAFMNLGGVRSVLPKGTILIRHVWNIYPFDSKVVMGRFKGRQLPAVVTAGRAVDPDREYTLALNEFSAENQANADQLGTSGLAFPTIGPLQRDLLVEWIRKKKVLE
jgi:5'-nucleotidase / UDP-sugar diphosphatase